MSDADLWIEDGAKYNWVMPSAPWWKRLPVIRHIRTKYLQLQVFRHNSFWVGAGLIPTGYDEWVLYGIWIGKERKP